jgi:hydroxypyruvate isomerase
MNRRAFTQMTVGVAIEQLLLRGNSQSASSQSGPRFSVMLWTLEKQAPFERCIEIVAAAGYQGMELVGEFQKWSSEETRRMMALIHASKLIVDSMSGVRAGFADADGATDFFAQLTTQITAAKELNCPQIILLSGKRIEGFSSKAQHSLCVENLKRAADLVAKDDLEIVIEPIDPLENPTIYLTTVREGFEIVREVGSPHIKVLYDFYHEQRSYGNLIEKLEGNIDLIGLVHIADVPGRHEPGTGEVDYTNVFRKLAELRYNKFIAMEFYPTQDPVATLTAARLSAQQAFRPMTA